MTRFWRVISGIARLGCLLQITIGDNDAIRLVSVFILWISLEQMASRTEIDN